MNIDAVIRELEFNCSADPFDKELVKLFVLRLTQLKNSKHNIMGGLLVHLLTMAENGDFKEEVKR